MSIRAKIVIVLVVALVVSVGATVMVLNQGHQANLDLIAESAVMEAETTFYALLDSDTARLAVATDLLREQEDYRSLFLAEDRTGLYDYAQAQFIYLEEEYRITHWYFERMAPESNVMVRIHNPDKYDDELTRITYQQAVDTEDIGAGLELGKTAFALRVVKPYYSADGQLIGYMELGEEIDHFFEIMNGMTGDDYALYVLKDMLDEESWASVREVHGEENNWDEYEEYMLVDATSDDIEFLEEPDVDLDDVADGGVVLASGDDEDEDEQSVVGAFPVYDASGAKVGFVMLERNVDNVFEALKTTQMTAVIWLAGIVLVVSLIVLLFMNRLVIARLGTMMTAMEDVSTRLLGGDYDVGAAIEIHGKDEIGEFEEFFAKFLGVIGSILSDLTKKAGE